MRNALKARAREDRDAGFTLIEILVAMVLMAIIMAALGVFFIGTQKASSALRMRQSATVLGDTAISKVHSLDPSRLLLNRDKLSSDAQWAAPVTGVDLSAMTELWDTTSSPAPANGTGLNPLLTPLPTAPQTTTVNGTPYTVSYFVGRCYEPNGGGACAKTPPTNPVAIDRVVVAVNWTTKGAACPNHTCAYVVASLISTTADPTFNVNEIVVDTTAPTSPSNVTCGPVAAAASGGDISIKGITWSPSSDASGIARYDIWDGPNPDFATMHKVGTSPTPPAGYVDVGLDPNKTYYYVVIAIDTVGNASAPQVPVGTVTNPQQPFMASCITKPDTVAPLAPGSAPTGTATANSVALAWTAGTDDYKVASYLVYRGATLVGNVTTPTLTFTDTGLTPWTNYTYTVRTVDLAGNVSSASAPFTIQTKDISPPTVPSGLVSAVNATVKTEIDLDWANSTDDVAVTGYTVCRSLAPTMTSPTCANVATSAFASTGLATSTKYYYTVKAFDAAGNTSAAATVTGTTPDSQPPTAPGTPTSPSQTASSVSLVWPASTDNVGVTGYQILRNGVVVNNSATASYTDVGLTDLTAYVYTIKAFDAAGNLSPASGPLNVTTLDGTPPTAPTLSSSSYTYTTITLNWTVATDNVAVTGYALYEDGNATPIANLGAGVYTYTDVGESPGTTHTYTVKAFDAAGNYSAYSNTVSVTTTTDTTPPSKVLGLKGTSSSKNTVTISWNTGSDNVGVVGYRIYSNGSLATTVAAPTVSQFYSGLPNSTTYNITVYAYDASGNTSPVSATLVCTVNGGGNVNCT